MSKSAADPQDNPGENDERELTQQKSQVRGPGQVDKSKIAQFVTAIKNAEQQVGEHIIRALQHEDTVAVITTVAMGPDGQQRVISAALSPERMQQVQEILQAAEDEREDEEPCVGFHCLVKPRQT
jgi:hypothetical protein